MNGEELRILDPAVWFPTVLKAKKPHLFGASAQPAPANTGIPSDGNPGLVPAPAGPKKDAMELDQKEWNDHKRNMGLM
jgi:hypothetical protein